MTNKDLVKATFHLVSNKTYIVVMEPTKVGRKLVTICTVSIVVLLMSGCYMLKPKNKCGTCPLWGGTKKVKNGVVKHP